MYYAHLAWYCSQVAYEGVSRHFHASFSSVATWYWEYIISESILPLITIIANNINKIATSFEIKQLKTNLCMISYSSNFYVRLVISPRVFVLISWLILTKVLVWQYVHFLTKFVYVSQNISKLQTNNII